MKDEKARIALVITRLDKGGAPDIVKSLFLHFKGPGRVVKLVIGKTTDPSASMKEFMASERENIIVIPELVRNPDPVSDVLAFIRLFFLFRREKFDIVHTHTSKAGFLGRIAAKLSGARLVVHTPHGHNLYGYFNPTGTFFVVMLERLAALFTDRITVFTNIEKEDMLKYGICPAQKIVVVRSGLDITKYMASGACVKEKRADFNVDTGDFLVGMISRLERVKGPEYFIAAAGIVADKFPRAKFLIVGDGPLKEYLAERSENLNLKERIIFTGWREDIPEILPVLDVVVLASLNEAVGRVLLESGASGKSVVATDVGGVPEIVENNVTGILVPSRDAGGMAEAIMSLLRDPEKRQRMGDKARERVKKNFSEERMAAEIRAIYDDAVMI